MKFPKCRGMGVRYLVCYVNLVRVLISLRVCEAPQAIEAFGGHIFLWRGRILFVYMYIIITCWLGSHSGSANVFE